MTQTIAAYPPSPLRNRSFWQLMAYRASTLLCYQIAAVTVGWHIYELTRSPFALGMIGLAEVLPFFCVAPFAGYLVDQLPRRKLGAGACVGLALTPLILLLVALSPTLRDQVWLMYAAVALNGIVRSFLGPVYNALFARVLPRDQYVRGASLGSVVFQTGLVVGPALGGALTGWASMTTAYAVSAVLGVIAAFAVFTVPVHEPPPPPKREPVFASIREGLRFVFSQQILLGAMALDMFSVLLGGAMSMLPAFTREILHAGPEVFGILRGMPALGSITVAIWLARHPLERNAGRILLFAVAGFGLCTLAFALSRNLYLSGALLIAYGMCDGVSVVMRSTILQLVTPDAMRGRVSSINSIFISSSNELGAFYDGVMARLFGLVPALLIGGYVTLSVVGITAWRAPKLRTLNLRELH